jgi:cysteinyl-tRNA synthetase
MRIYNTLSGQKEDLGKALGGSKKIRLFVCGLTVYDYPHIGNARVFLIYDVFVRYLRSLGFKVFYLQNITDIDDKIIKRAQEEKTAAKTIAKKYEKIYLQDIKKLNITTVNKYARATDHIPQIVKQVQTLIKKGCAYLIPGEGYYFDISAFPEYGKLAKRTVLQAEDAVSRIDESLKKRNKGDFALWKLSKPEEPFWNTALGKGRPGWHIEDTAITEYYFGPQYDIHGGAVELKFPHHEAEIAQQESASGKTPLVKIWMHAGILLINGRKMSKSLGNFLTIRNFLAHYSPDVLRWIIVSHHYRLPIDYKESMALNAQQSLNNLSQLIAKLKLITKNSAGNLHLNQYEKRFQDALSDDFNTPSALAVIFELINQINPKIWNLNKKSGQILSRWLLEKLNLFGIKLKLPKIPLKIGRLAAKRELFRIHKQFIQADDLRKQIETLGYTIEDTPRGPFLWPANSQ